MRQKKRKENPWTDPLLSSPPRRNYEITPRTPSASRGHGPTIEPCSRKWNALAVRSQVGRSQGRRRAMTHYLLSEILRRVALWRAQYDESCKLCSGGVIVYRWPLWQNQQSERRWFTLRRMSLVRVRLSPTRELSRYKAL
ncbi:hypothetical protein RND71_026419 [Anisodus tanguticus]|uniref:Uncharacterized protein n=1 Tax=Anisodus tanguticus TaxID=243964 RepID=A0AAE1RMC8_9SOLA|nr:hypothetical protein RND71_026419 [Anisodus tanguticus]